MKLVLSLLAIKACEGWSVYNDHDCWGNCHHRGGKCESCPYNGYCCRWGSSNGDCPSGAVYVTSWGQTDRHRCVYSFQKGENLRRVGGHSCYYDRPSRDMTGAHRSTDNNTPTRCVEWCRGQGFSYAAVEVSNECFCDNTYGTYGPASNHGRHCDHNCKGDDKQKCGGDWALSVYYTDYDHCGKTDNCHKNANCVTDASTPNKLQYTCTCKTGFSDNYAGYSSDYKDYKGRACNDIKECDDDSKNTCNKTKATCHETEGSYHCTCNSGYTENYAYVTAAAYGQAMADSYKQNQYGRYCNNIDECDNASLNTCHETAATCHDTDGSYHCTCNSGYTDAVGHITTPAYAQSTVDVYKQLYYGRTCNDINECDDEDKKRCDEVATCENTIGDHKCTCPLSYLVPDDSSTMAIGYTDPNGDGSDCQDIDECAENPCHGDAVCTNTIGSYHCDCNEGHQGEGHECTLCHDESTWSTEGDDVTAMKAVCGCNAGYHGDGDLCEDIDECEDGTHLCDPNATCTNTIASHYCTCNVGYYGFGQTCTACDPETHLDEMEFECGTDKISVTIPYCAFYNVDITNHAFMGTGENCTMENTGINMEMSIPTTSECGTTVTNNGTYLVYANAIVGDVREHDGVVTRKKFIDLDFDCAFEADFDLSSDNMVHAMIDHVDIKLKRQNKEFDIQMGVFTDDTFTELVHDDYSIVVPDIIHAAVQLMDGEDALVLLAEKCWATPSSDPEDEVQYVFLDNFCSTIDTDGIFNIGRNGVDREAQFELESFEFDGYLDGIIYLHCHANVCDTELEDCSVDCTDSGRRRRSNNRNRRSIGETSSPLRVGPIRVIDPNH